MKAIITLFLCLGINMAFGQELSKTNQEYLTNIKTELEKTWPKNRTINIVFHGHSVPTGYFKTPHVNTFSAFPHLTHRAVKETYPNAVVNVITTSIGGENSVAGCKRFTDEVLTHRPDILFIDYGLNDRNAGLEAARESWVKMIKSSKENNIPLVLMTPSPDLNYDILDPNTDLSKHAAQIKELAKEYDLMLVDSYELFKELARSGEDLNDYMATKNHPNARGHKIIAAEISKLFR